MVNRARRSRSFKRTAYRTPGGENKIRYKRKIGSQPSCGDCGTVLKGVPKIVSKYPKTQRRPERPFGGVLCSACMRNKIKAGART